MQAESRRNLVAMLTFLGAVASAFGIVVGFLEISNELLKESAKVSGALGSVIFIAGIVVSIRYLPEDLKEHVRLDDRSVPDNLRKLVAKPEVLYYSLQNKADIVEHIVGDVLYKFLSDDVHSYMNQLETFQVDGTPIKLVHTTSVYGTLNSLLGDIPTNACWLGVTHIGSRTGWETSQRPDMQEFDFFQGKSIDLSSKDKINMFRVYITTANELEGLKAIIDRESEAGIRTKYIVVERESDRNNYADVSLIWVPKTNKKVLKQVDFKDSDIVTTIEKAKNYEPLCSLQFESHHLSLLSSVTISSANKAKSTFEPAVLAFKNAWGAPEAKSL